MIIGTCIIKLKADWCHSLKEKRMVVNSIVDKSKKKFNISISEIESMDIHNLIVLGIATVTNSSTHADSVIENTINFIEDSTEAYIVDVFKEIL